MRIIDVIIAMEPSAKKECFLCGRAGGYMIRFERWSEKEKDYALAHLDTLPPHNSVQRFYYSLQQPQKRKA